MKKIKGMAVVVSEQEKEEYLKRISGICERGWFMDGPEQELLKKRFRNLTNREHAETFNSATSALDAVFAYLRQKGKRRACFQANHFPSPSFSAYRHGFELVWSDIDVKAMTPDLDTLDKLWHETKFDVLVLQWTGGFIPTYAHQIAFWARSHNVTFVEDASHAVGSHLGGNYALSFGDIGVASLAATKAVHAGQGGILVTDDEALATFAFRHKNYGRTLMFQKGEYTYPGHNHHMTEMQAALGNVMLNHMEERQQYRMNLASIYLNHLKYDLTFLGQGMPDTGIWLPRPNFYKVVALLPDGVDRNALRRYMQEQGVELGSEVYNFVTPSLPLMQQLRRENGHLFVQRYADVDVPNTEWFSQRHICLPMHNGLTEDDVKYVVEHLREGLKVCKR